MATFNSDPTELQGAGDVPYAGAHAGDARAEWAERRSTPPAARQIAGVDMEDALRRVEDVSLLVELLVQFARTWRDGATRIARALEVGGVQRAGDVAHALAGVAATLAVGRVRDAARRIETMLLVDGNGAIEAELAELDDALQAFVLEMQRSHALD